MEVSSFSMQAVVGVNTNATCTLLLTVCAVCSNGLRHERQRRSFDEVCVFVRE